MMENRLPNWDDAQLILTIRRAGSLKQAAAQLGVHTSTVSRRLDNLEEVLGIRLFDRTPDGAVATDAAMCLLPFAESMEHTVAEMSRSIDGLETRPEGTVRITAPPGVVDHFFGEFIAELLAAYPELRIELISSVSYADLGRGEADLALRVHRPTSGDLTSLCVINELPGAVFGAEPQTIGSREFSEARFVTYGPQLAHLPQCRWVMDHCEPSQIVLRTNSMTAQLQAARHGVGFAVLAEAYDSVDGLGRIRFAPTLARKLAPLPTDSLFLVTHRALRHVPRIAVTWEALRRRFAPA